MIILLELESWRTEGHPDNLRTLFYTLGDIKNLAWELTRPLFELGLEGMAIP